MRPSRRLLPLLALGVLAGVASPLAAAAPAPPVPHFSRVVVIVLENRERGEVLPAGAVRLAALGRRYAEATDYAAVAHPSLPNYLVLVSGSTHGITTDCDDCVVDAPNLADVLEAAGKGWKTYAEGLPGRGYDGQDVGRYAKKHVPFLYFADVLPSPPRRRRIVPLDRFAQDLARGTLPAFSLVVPDLCHDMHDCSTAVGDRWTAGFLAPLLRSRQLEDGVVFVTFDEGTSSLRGGGRVALLALGPLVRPGAVARQPLDHYGLLATIELGLGVRPLLGAAATARPLTGIWKREAG